MLDAWLQIDHEAFTMAIEFALPDIGEGVSEGEIVGWLVKVGDTVDADQDMVEVMTDKATVTIGAPEAGRIAEIRAQEGDTVPVGQVLVVIETSGAAGAAAAAPAEKAPPPAAEPKAAAHSAPSGASESVASAVGDIREALPGMGANPEPTAPAQTSSEAHFNDKPLAAPKTRKLARELDVDLRRVTPTGAGGRVTDEDVRRTASGAPAHKQDAPESVAKAPPLSAPPSGPVQSLAGAERKPIRGLRKRSYENMARSKRTAAHFTYMDECEVSALVEARRRLALHAEQLGVKLNFLPFIIKAVVAALKKNPQVNALVDDERMEIIESKSYDIGIATATDAGLIVPVLRGADRLSLLEIAREIDRLSREARAGKARREDLGGSSFTVTSLGKLGGLAATPVVNYPEVAILYIPEIKKKPVVKGDQIVIGQVITLSLSFDHRIIDGHVGAAFAQDVRALLQDPDRLHLES